MLRLCCRDWCCNLLCIIDFWGTDLWLELEAAASNDGQLVKTLQVKIMIMVVRLSSLPKIFNAWHFGTARQSAFSQTCYCCWQGCDALVIVSTASYVCLCWVCRPWPVVAGWGTEAKSQFKGVALQTAWAIYRSWCVQLSLELTIYCWYCQNTPMLHLAPWLCPTKYFYSLQTFWSQLADYKKQVLSYQYPQYASLPKNVY